jgi:hypothetical protein
MQTATRGPGAISAIAASSRVNPALSLPIRITAIGLPAAPAISTSWVSRWVSIPMTASTTSVSMVMRPDVSFQGQGRRRHRPGRSHRVAYL